MRKTSKQIQKQDKVKGDTTIVEFTPVPFFPLHPKGKHPDLVVVSLKHLMKASIRHRKEIQEALQAERERVVEEILKIKAGENLGLGKLNHDEKVAIAGFKEFFKHYLRKK